MAAPRQDKLEVPTEQPPRNRIFNKLPGMPIDSQLQRTVTVAEKLKTQRSNKNVILEKDETDADDQDLTSDDEREDEDED